MNNRTFSAVALFGLVHTNFKVVHFVHFSYQSTLVYYAQQIYCNRQCSLIRRICLSHSKPMWGPGVA